jgi:asparagine synthase (glutamine-hydrolysing)
MSVQWGQWNFDAQPVDSEHERRTKEILLTFPNDGIGRFTAAGIHLLFASFHTTPGSAGIVQPLELDGGLVLMFDGRLDNGPELVNELHAARGLSDVRIVGDCYSRWGARCLPRLLGDWALSVWSPRDQSLLLARDFAGVRHLFYSSNENRVIWSTILEPLVLLSQRPLRVDEEYVAGWLGAFPATHLTPFGGFWSVPPASFVVLERGRISVHSFWSFDSTRTLRYSKDSDYEDHLRNVFFQAVRRRLRSNGPVVAELSGGMDSSSIVCFADRVMAQHPDECPHPVETLTYYDDSEPNWDELPYAANVERTRKRSGLHVDLAGAEVLRQVHAAKFLAVCPAVRNSPSTKRSIVEYLGSLSSRVILSGIGGDELMGGVATPLPELADLLAAARPVQFLRRSTEWCLALRQPFLYLAAEVFSMFFPKYLAAFEPSPWLNSAFVERHRNPLGGYGRRATFFGERPSFTMHLNALDSLRRQFGCSSPSPDSPFEKRYPFLDRDLLEFLFGIPRSQIVRPGQRRALMRRAFRGIVPDEILDRRRKAFVARSPLLAIAGDSAIRGYRPGEMLSEALGYVDGKRFAETIDRVRRGQEVPLSGLLRAIALESWLRGLLEYGFLEVDPLAKESLSRQALPISLVAR